MPTLAQARFVSAARPQPRVTHAGIPGRTRKEKRATLKGVRRAAVEYHRIKGHYPSV